MFSCFNCRRFPYICYANVSKQYLSFKKPKILYFTFCFKPKGGATFLIPYFLMLLVVGLPTFFMELVIGQYAGMAATKVYARMAPGLRGLGYGMVSIPMLINFQYVVVMAYAMYYMFMGFTSDLPWAECGRDFSGAHCYSVEEAESCVDDYGDNTYYYDHRCVDGSEFCALYNMTNNANGTCSPLVYGLNDSYVEMPFQDVTYRVSPSEEYWYNHVLNIAVENGHLVIMTIFKFAFPNLCYIWCFSRTRIRTPGATGAE